MVFLGVRRALPRYAPPLPRAPPSGGARSKCHADAADNRILPFQLRTVEVLVNRNDALDRKRHALQGPRRHQEIQAQPRADESAGATPGIGRRRLRPIEAVVGSAIVLPDICADPQRGTEPVRPLAGAPRGSELIAAKWADNRGVPQVVFKPDWARHQKAAPFKSNDAMLEAMPIGVIAFPGSGITENLVDKAKARRIPVRRYGTDT